MLDEFEVTGRARTHVVQVSNPRFAAQQGVATALLDMRRAAAFDGIDLLPVSSFRDYGTQLRIWNRKFDGTKPLYDKDALVRARASMEAIKRVTPTLLLEVTSAARMLAREAALDMRPAIYEEHSLNFVGPDAQMPVIRD